MIKKLRLKFVMINMSIVTAMLCVILGLVFQFTRANLESESIQMMENAANHPFELGVPSEFGEEVRLPYFTLYLGPEGEVLSTSGGYYDLSDADFLKDLLAQALSSPQKLGVIDDYHLRYYRVDTPPNRCIVFADISSELATLRNLNRTCGLIGVLAFLAFLVVSILLSKWAVAPVERAWRQQRKFVADASHELKTPLTVIMTNAQLLQMPECDEEGREKSAAAILTMSGQMRGLIQQMLELARADAAEKRVVYGKVEYSKLVSDAILPFEPVFFEKGLLLHSQVAENIQIKGSESELRQLVEILLDNAQKYSCAGGTTRVSLERRGKKHCILTVANEGEPIPQEELKNIFKRFYRVDTARSRGRDTIQTKNIRPAEVSPQMPDAQVNMKPEMIDRAETISSERKGSYGLGLSIAETIVKQHHGKIKAASEEQINTFCVELPCYGADKL